MARQALRSVIAFLILVLLVSLAGSETGVVRAQTPGASPPVGMTFGPQQVLALSGSQLLAFQQQCPPLAAQPGGSPSCVLRAMQQAGATDDALAFYRLTGHILTQFQSEGMVNLGTVVHDLWCCTADTSDMEPVLLGGIPATIYPLEETTAIDLKSYAGYDTASTQSPALAYRGLDGVALEQVTSSPEGGQRFIFANDLINGCRACGTGYVARLAFDFDTGGGYVGTVPLDIRCHSGAAMAGSSASGCAASSQ